MKIMNTEPMSGFEPETSSLPKKRVPFFTLYLIDLTPFKYTKNL
jgi:hypothetical protein